MAAGITLGKGKAAMRGWFADSQPKTMATASVAITQEMIARRAREIWERKGRPAGRDIENWSEAEAQLRAGQTPKAG